MVASIGDVVGGDDGSGEDGQGRNKSTGIFILACVQRDHTSAHFQRSNIESGQVARLGWWGGALVVSQWGGFVMVQGGLASATAPSKTIRPAWANPEVKARLDAFHARAFVSPAGRRRAARVFSSAAR